MRLSINQGELVKALLADGQTYTAARIADLSPASIERRAWELLVRNASVIVAEGIG